VLQVYWTIVRLYSFQDQFASFAWEFNQHHLSPLLERVLEKELIDAAQNLLHIQFTLMTQAEQCAAECGADFFFTSNSLVEVARSTRKRSSVELGADASAEHALLNRGNLAIVSRKTFKQQSLLAKARRDCLPYKQTNDPILLSQILTELEKHEEAISLAFACDISPAYALSVHL